MATKRKKPAALVGNSFFVEVGQHNNISKFDDLEDDQKGILMSVHFEMMQNFINFCKEKKVDFVRENPKDSLFEEKQRNAFKEKVTTYFGEFLHSHVVDALCDLVEENSHDKCHHCIIPVESLVLSVLQILFDPSHCTSEAQTTKFHMKAPGPNNNHAPSNCISSKGRASSVFEKSIRTNCDIGKHAMSDKGLHQSAEKTNIASNSLLNKIKSSSLPILDTPVFLKSSVSSKQAPLMPMNCKSKPNHYLSKLRVPSEPPSQAPANFIGEETKSKGSNLDLAKIDDQLYNKKNVNTPVMINTPPAIQDLSRQHQFQRSQRFNVSETEIRYYNVLCGLAHSQWSS